MRPLAFGLLVCLAAMAAGSALSAWIAIDPGRRLAAATRAWSAPGPLGCADDLRCDTLTGCTLPSRAPRPLMEALPDDQAHRRYVDALKAFRPCRQSVEFVARGNTPEVVRTAGASSAAISFAELANRWNGDVLWAPASASTDVITRFGDEARAVFGPIPDIDCGDNAAKVIPLEIDGNIVDLKPNPGVAGSPLQFEHRDTAGRVVKWSTQIARCDKPSLAGNVTYCGMNSRVSRKVIGSVEWVALCRKSSPHQEIDPEPYWQRNNPNFARLGVIGFNRQSGEIAFFDGSKDRPHFDWERPFVPPGGRSYHDESGRMEAAGLYDPTFQIQCSACHDNKGPYVISPHMGLSRIGYEGGATGESASAFSLGDYIPTMPHEERLPFRVIGSAYTSTYATDLARAQTLQDPSGNCTECHTLTTQVTGQRIAADAAGRDPVITDPSWSDTVSVRAELQKLREIDAHRTDWARRSGEGKIHPWMVPRNGGKVGAGGHQIDEDDWRQLSNCIWEAGGAECNYRPLYTACPPPATPSGGDGSLPTDLSIAILPSNADEGGAERVLRLNWRYLNDYGGVPQRDDVRFNIAIRSVPIPQSRKPPDEEEYPAIAEASDDGFVAIAGNVGNVGNAGGLMTIRNLSYIGHRRFTEPAPATTPREFRADVPAMCGQRYLARILPKRFCFDQNGIQYAERGELVFADVECN
ncbi:hypothetical protein [Rhizobium grahamii]|nr:hypothetical protein [Rhizobium grahamii]